MENVPENVVLEVFRELFPGSEETEIRMFSRGWNSILYSINGQYIVKFSRDEYASDDMKRDIEITGKIRPYLEGIRIPDYIYHTYRNGLLVGIYKMIEGTPLIQSDPLSYGNDSIFNSLKSTERESLASSLSGTLLQINRVPVEILYEHGKAGPQKWADRFKKTIENYEKVCLPYFPEDTREKVSSLLEYTMKQILLASFSEVPIHGDFGGWNILYSMDRGKISGILDWGGMVFGDPAYDISELLVSFGEDFTESVVHLTYRNDDGIMDRARIYAGLAGFMDITYGIRLGSNFLIKSGVKILMDQL